jgi:hypothetical protein
MGYPYGYNADVEPQNENVLKALTDDVNGFVFNGQQWVGRLARMGGASAYNAYGCACDHMFVSQHIRFSGKMGNKAIATIFLGSCFEQIL